MQGRLSIPTAHKRLATSIGSSAVSSRRTKPIEEIAEGDWVWAWNLRTRTRVKSRVKRTFRHASKPLVTLQILTGVEAERIQATAEHPFWVQSRGWTPARQVEVGSVLLTLNGTACTVTAIERNTLPRRDVFNFEVEHFHNYWVGRQGVLVHNLSDLPRGTERFGIEREMGPQRLMHLLPYVDLDHFRQITGVDLEKLGAQMARERNIRMSPRTQAYAVITTHADFQSLQYGIWQDSRLSPLRLKPTASKRLQEVWHEYERGRDGDALEWRTPNDRPQFGFDNIRRGLLRLTYALPEPVEVNLPDVAGEMQLHLSRSGVQLEYMARAASLHHAVHYVGAGDLDVLRKQISGYRFVAEKGIFRLVDYEEGAINDHAEGRDLNMERLPFRNVDRIVTWARHPEMAYRDSAQSLAQTRLGSDLAAQHMFNSDARPVFVDDVRRLLRNDRSQPFFVDALQQISSWDPAMARVLLGRAPTIYSYPSPR